MAVAEFEERSFEVPMNYQLLAGSSHIYTPGQVLEAALGFDAAMLSHHQAFWSLWGSPTVPPGLVPEQGWWGSSAAPLPALPTFNLNLFLQYKRPQKLERSNASEWSHWSQPYFRYAIVDHQQAALESCASSLGGNGRVVYAAPAFISLADLFQHTVDGTLVSATNFVEASKLNSHGCYTYSAAGKAGQAFSEPTEIPPTSVSEGMGAWVEQAPDIPRGSHILKIASTAVRAAMVSTWAPSDIEKFEKLIERDASVFDDVPLIRRHDEDGAKLRAYLWTVWFCAISGWSWLVGGPASTR